MAEVASRVPPLDAQYLLVYKKQDKSKLVKVFQKRGLKWLSRDELKELLDEGHLGKDKVKEIKEWICYRKECPAPDPIPVSYEKLSAYLIRRVADYHFFFGQFVATQVGTPQYTKALDELMSVFSRRLNYFTVLSNQVPSYQLSTYDQVREFWISVSGTPTSYFQGWTRHNHANIRVAPILNSTEFQGSTQTHLIEYSSVMFPSSTSNPFANKILASNKVLADKVKEKALLGQNPVLQISDEGNYNINWRYEEDGVWRIVQWWNDTDLAFELLGVYVTPTPYLPEPNFTIFPPNP
jgi:hypothetical protein